MNSEVGYLYPKGTPIGKDKEMGKEKEKEEVMKRKNTSLGWDTKPRQQIEKGWLRRKKKKVGLTREFESRYTRYSICDIRQSFRSAGFMFDNQVAIIEEEYTLASVHDAGILVYPCAPDTEINNWKIIEFPCDFKLCFEVIL
ncbi:hypothetical protein SESBI_29693 [Sesbania bispinosa]|nr:hypothetical protein SESBI_29693 [Sesbania bispinosa]